MNIPSVAGSEKFTSRQVPVAALRAEIAPTLCLHSPDVQGSVDALTYEVVRHRIWAITDEMGETLRRMSGSPGVTEANDFDFALCDELGQEVQVGLYNTGLVASMDLAIYWILRHRSENPGIHPGDMFLCNDPWVGGGLHQNDAAVIAPVFHGEELFGWTSAVCHLIDVGGAKPGSADLAATDVFTEAVPTPPVKIMRGGVLQADVVDMFVRRSRLPQLVELDLRALVGANRTGVARLNRLVDRYGPGVVKTVMKGMMDDAERRLRDRLNEVPDGEWFGTAYIEQAGSGDRGLHKIELRMSKTDSQLTFDFTGTDQQTGMINCPYSGMRAGVMFALLPILAGDIPWSANGLMRCFDLIADEGTLNNATYPAAVGWAPLTAAWATSNVVAECLSKMLDTSLDLRGRVQSVCTGADIVTLAGINQRGEPVVSLLLDTMAGGHGARPAADGADTAGILPIPMGRAPDVEMQEFLYPLLYLWRREEVDSAGPGQYRGGASISLCVIPHGTPAPMMGAFTCNGKDLPEATGLAGGYPGGRALDIIVRDSVVRDQFALGRLPSTLDELGGSQCVVPNRHETVVNPQDAIYVHPGGGGGYGDPLLRDPHAVHQDLLDAKVSQTAALDIYGVVFTPFGLIDRTATNLRRDDIRLSRLDTDQRAAELRPEGPHDNSIDVGRCAHCEAPIRRATMVVQEDRSSAVHVNARPMFRQLCCRRCGTACVSEVVNADVQPRVGATEID